MSGQAMEQTQAAASEGVQAKPQRVSADSFRMLTQRLQSRLATPQPAIPVPPVAVPAQEPAPQGVAIPRVVQPEPQIPEIELAAVVAVPPPEIPALPQTQAEITDFSSFDSAPAEEQPEARAAQDAPPPAASIAEPAPLAIEPEVHIAAAGELIEVAAVPQATFTVRAAPPVLTAPPQFGLPPESMVEPEQAPDTSAILSDRIGRVLAMAARPAQQPPEALALPPILPPPEATSPVPAKPQSELSLDVIQELHRINADVKRRRDSELEYNMRMIFAVPTLDERAQYLEEAAYIAQMEKAQEEAQSRPVEDLEALAMEHIGKFAAGEDGTSPFGTEQAPQISPEGPAVQAESLAEAAHEVPADDAFATAPVEHNAELPVETAAPESHVVPATEIAPALPVQQPRERAPAAAPKEEPVHSAVKNMSEHQVSDLARSLLDMMASGSNAGLPQERALAADTLLRILPRLPQRSLIQLSERLAMMEHPPHMIAGRILQHPDIEVSGPLIENGVNLGERELISLIETGEAQKLRLVARRRRLSRAITTLLIANGNPSVLLTLVRNAHAELAHESFVALTQHAQDDPDLLAPLATRADLPAPQAFELFWLAPPQLRRYLLSRFLTDSETLTKILKITLATQGGELAADSAIDPAQTVAALQLLQQARSAETLARFAQLAQVSDETVARIFEDTSGEPLVVLLKILALPRTELKDWLQQLQRSEDGPLDPSRDIEELQAMFDTLSYNKARILLTYWEWSTQKTGPYAPVH